MQVNPLTGAAPLAGPAAAAMVRIPVQEVVSQVARTLGLSPQQVVAMVAGGASLSQIAARLGLSRDELLIALRHALAGGAAARTASWNAVVLEATVTRMADQRDLGTMAYLTTTGGLVAAAEEAARSRTRRRELRPRERRKGTGAEREEDPDADPDAARRSLPDSLTEFLDEAPPGGRTGR